MSESQPDTQPLPVADRPAGGAAASAAPEPPALSLLADPRTIAGETLTDVGPIETPAPALSVPPRMTPEPPAPLPAASGTRPRLDAAAARALSEEAKRRSESSRAELEAARRDLATQSPSPPEGWRTHPLTRRASEVLPAPATDETDARVEALEQLLERRSETLESKNAELAKLTERIDAQALALERTRAALEDERQAHTALRAAVESAALVSPATAETAEAKADPGTEIETAPPVVETAERDLGEAQRWPSIHDAWLDDQLRRHFGPLGIDRLADWVRQRLERHPDLGVRPLRITWLGSGGLAPVLPLAEDLLHHLGAPFSMGVLAPPNASVAGLQTLPSDHPLGRVIEHEGVAESADDLARRLASQTPDLILSRYFFSALAAQEPWIQPLERAWQEGSELILMERSGLGADAPTPALTEMGDRIWELLPSRYVAEDSGEPAFADWTDAFATTQPHRARGALQKLKQRFPFELTAQFGFLSEVFVATPIGDNFSAKIPKDRRFLRQVADLDERRIEAGTAPALYGAALVAAYDGSRT